MAFETPRDIHQVFDWNWPRHTLQEQTETAVERFIQEGMLIPASLQEKLSKLFQVAQLKKLLVERSLSTSGTKPLLIERLVAHDVQGMTRIAGNTIVKCSDAALGLIADRKQKVERDTVVAKRLTYEAFRAGNPKEACRIYEAFRRYSYHLSYKISLYDVEGLQFILTGHPKILSNFSPEDLRAVQLAGCMKTLWKSEPPERWLPELFISPFKDNRIPVNYLIRNAEFQRNLSSFRRFSKQVKIRFHSGDIESCNLCLPLDGKVFDIDALPDLPIPGCTSETGCMCNLDWGDDDDFEKDDDAGEAEISMEITDENLSLQNPVGTLRVLKQMLSDGLITQAEYDEKKNNILSQL